MRGSQQNENAPVLDQRPAGSADTQGPWNHEHNDEEPFAPPLSAEQARELRGRLTQVSPWVIVGAQVGMGLLAAMVAGAVFKDPAIGWSLAYGAMAVALPAGVFARALRRGAKASVLLWEWVKLGLTVALLLAAPRLVPGLNWLALLAGVVLATKMYWVAFAWSRRRRRIGN